MTWINARPLRALVACWLVASSVDAATLVLEDTRVSAEDHASLETPAFLTPGAITLGGAGGDTTVSWFNNGSTLLRDSANNPLSQGAAAANQDGALVQFGFFTTGTTGSNFAGDFVPLTFGTHIGDSAGLTGEGAGRIGFQAFFTSGSSTVDVFDSLLDAGAYTTVAAVSISGTIPAPNQVLAIRFFDTTNGATGFFNTVSADTWLWQTPTPLGATLTIDFANSTLEWQDPANAFRTTLPVPEPSIASAVIFGVLLVSLRRRGSER